MTDLPHMGSLEQIFNAALDAGSQADAANAILAHPGSVGMNRECLEVLREVAFEGVVIEASHLEVYWCLAECWEVLGAAQS